MRKQLAKMQAENRERIILVKRNIEPDGCLALTKPNWPKISIIDFE